MEDLAKSSTFDEAKVAGAIAKRISPLGGVPALKFMQDGKTGARFCECYVDAKNLSQLATVDVALDPDEQGDYRANRDLVEDAAAFEQMKEDALDGRTFSNIVAEYDFTAGIDKPVKIIGGQHRFTAIQAANNAGVNKYHGLKLYVELDKSQRLDVQLISNTNIAVSGDLIDRMQETVRGPELRNWCQDVGFLSKGKDFTSRRARGGPISVQIARSFIINYFRGKKIKEKNFGESETTPLLTSVGKDSSEWNELIKKNPGLWKDSGLKTAATEFSRLHIAQAKAFSGKKGQPDFPEKAMNLAILSAWAFVAGTLSTNAVRLKRHFGLADSTGKDPLNAAALAAGRHRSDPQNYRGLGYRTDPKERGRLVELFFLQAEKGEGITKAAIDLAMKKYHAKVAILEVKKSGG